jgi:hypothetical protein
MRYRRIGLCLRAALCPHCLKVEKGGAFSVNKHRAKTNKWALAVFMIHSIAIYYRGAVAGQIGAIRGNGVYAVLVMQLTQ